MLLSLLACGGGTLLLINLFITYPKTLNERHTNRQHLTPIPTSNRNMEHDKNVKLWHLLYNTENVYGNRF